MGFLLFFFGIQRACSLYSGPESKDGITQGASNKSERSKTEGAGPGSIVADSNTLDEASLPPAAGSQSVYESSNHVYLETSTFLQANKRARAYDEKDFKSLLTACLLKNSPKVREHYSDDTNMWTKMAALNPRQFKKILGNS